MTKSAKSHFTIYQGDGENDKTSEFYEQEFINTLHFMNSEFLDKTRT